MNIIKTLWERLFMFYQNPAGKNKAGVLIPSMIPTSFPYINAQDGALVIRCGTIDEKKIHKTVHKNLSGPSMAICVANLTNSGEGLANLSKVFEKKILPKYFLYKFLIWTNF